MSEQSHKLHQLAWWKAPSNRSRRKYEPWGDCDHGVVMDLEHVALGWCVRFAGQIISRTVKGADCVQRVSACVSSSHAFSTVRQYIDLGSEQEEGSDRRQAFRHKVLCSSLFEHLLVVWCAELKDGVKTQQTTSFVTASVGTTRRLLPDDEPREPRDNRCELMCVLCILTSSFNQHGRSQATSRVQKTQLSWLDRTHIHKTKITLGQSSNSVANIVA